MPLHMRTHLIGIVPLQGRLLLLLAAGARRG
jgi:hypothetical protein